MIKCFSSKFFQYSLLSFLKFHNKKANLLFIMLKLVLILILFFLFETTQAQFPFLKTELKTNISKITCLDDFELEAKQINWQFFSQKEKQLLFQKIHFITPEIGYGLVDVWGAGENHFFVKTTDQGKTWNFDSKINRTYVSHMQLFGNDTIILYGKRIINWNTYEYERYRYFSKNGGASWDSLRNNLPIDQTLTYFVNYKVAYCIDLNNSFFVSTDGGINWVKQSEVNIGFKKTLYSPKINDVFLLNDNALYKSNDGGKSWRNIPLPIENGLTSLSIKDNIGFISCRLGRILKTKDGGETWQMVQSKLFPHLLNIDMLNKDSVFAVGDLGTILFSPDAGISWQEQFAINRNDLYTLQVLDHKNIFAGGIFGVFKYYKPEILSGYQWEPKNLILSTDDNRATANSTNDSWFSVNAKNSKGQSFTDSILVDINAPGVFISSDSVMDNTSRIRLHSLTDAGTWSFQKEEFVMVVYHDFEIISKDTLIIGGQYDANGVILKSTDGGKNWFHINQNIKYRIDDIEFINSKIGYAGGYLGYLIKTIDGGNHWEELISPTKEDIKSISFIDENIGYMAANQGQVYKTNDGGKTWEYSYVRYDWAIKILFLNEQKGFLLHNYSGFLSTIDGGKTWQEVPHDKFFDVTDITFVNENVGYAVGSMLGPFLYIKTVDGGKTWVEKIFPRWTLTTYQTISFKNEYNGFVFNQLGELITTGDGGQNWFILDTLKYNEPNAMGNNGFPINSFHFINDNTGIGVGNGQIVRYEFSPKIKYSWSPDTKVSWSTTSNPLVPKYLSHTYKGSIFRDNDCGVYDWVNIPQFNVSVPIITQQEITIYPQPANDELFISSSSLPAFELIEIFDVKGICKYSLKIKGNNGKVTIKPKLRSGIYIIAISGEKQTVRKQISFQ